MSEDKGLLKPVIVGIMVTVIGGLLLAYFNNWLFPTKTIVPISSAPEKEKQVEISYTIVARHLILGPNPGGVWAFKPGDGAKQLFLWHTVDIFISNNCSDKIYINPQKFQLSYSPGPEFDRKNVYLPTDEGLNFQTDRLKTKWLQSGESLQGRLVFKVRDKVYDKTDDGTDILRYNGHFTCPVTYTR